MPKHHFSTVAPAINKAKTTKQRTNQSDNQFVFSRSSAIIIMIDQCKTVATWGLKRDWMDNTAF
jgi:hypothetical protein